MIFMRDNFPHFVKGYNFNVFDSSYVVTYNLKGLLPRKMMKPKFPRHHWPNWQPVKFDQVS